MTTNIYILKLENNNYYVGKSNNVQKRFQQHLSGNGSSWTQLHKPLEIIKVIPNVSVFEEDSQVKELMSIHGINKVRGGSYTQIELSQIEKLTLQKEIWNAQDACTRCGRYNHFVKDCYASKDINNNKIDDLDDLCDEYVVWCCEYCDKEYYDEKDCEQHEILCNKLKNNNSKYSRYSRYNNSKYNSCYRCGRNNHYINDCYASTHIDGYELDD
jgi:hypothetical protein